MLMLCLVFAVAGPVMPGAGDVSPMDPTMAYGAAPTMLVFAPDGGAGFDLMGQDSFDQILTSWKQYDECGSAGHLWSTEPEPARSQVPDGRPSDAVGSERRRFRDFSPSPSPQLQQLNLWNTHCDGGDRHL